MESGHGVREPNGRSRPRPSSSVPATRWTASIHRAKKIDGADISQVFVPVKIIVVQPNRLEEMECPTLSVCRVGCSFGGNVATVFISHRGADSREPEPAGEKIFSAVEVSFTADPNIVRAGDITFAAGARTIAGPGAVLKRRTASSQFRHNNGLTSIGV